MLMERNIDGLIVLSSTLEDQELEALAKELPVVLTGRATLNQKLTSIGFDNLGGGAPRSATWPTWATGYCGY